MKKTFLSLIILMGSAMALAQPPARPYDTIVGREVTYLYIPEWMEETDSNLPRDFYCMCTYHSYCTGSNPEMAIRYETDSALSIIGIAVSCSTFPGQPLPEFLRDSNLANWFETLRLYKHTPDSQMTVLAQGTFNILNISRWIKNCRYSFAEYDTTYTYYYPIYEVLFDKPVQVTDSFYVGMTFHNNAQEGGLFPNHNTFILNHYFQPPILNNRIAEYNPSLGGWKFYFNQTGYYDYRCYFLFPIFDTTGMGLSPHCDPVTNLHQGSTWSNCTMLLWDSTSGQIAWQLAVGRADQDPDGYYIYNNLPSPSKTLYNLEYNTLYAARVRAKCEGNRNYSPWSDTIHFSITREQGIDTAPDSEPLFSLNPNPARESVTVTLSPSLSDLRSCRLTLHDAAGHEILSIPLDSRQLTIPTSGLPAGLYLFTLHSPQGSHTARLVIE